MLPRRRLAVGIGVALAATAVSVTYASIPDSNGVIHACYNPSRAAHTGGASLAILDADAASCAKKDVAISWSQQGPQGEKGDPGPQGPQGPQGPAGPAGAGTAYTNHGGLPQAIGEGLTQTVASVTVPPGSYTISATVRLTPGSDDTRFGSCGFVPGNGRGVLVRLEDDGDVRNEPLIGDLTTASASPIFLRCTGLDGPITAAGALVVTSVGAVIPSE
jgi:hypothetical protein